MTSGQLLSLAQWNWIGIGGGLASGGGLGPRELPPQATIPSAPISSIKNFAMRDTMPDRRDIMHAEPVQPSQISQSGAPVLRQQAADRARDPVTLHFRQNYLQVLDI
jgi:hypothetical protein